MSAAHGQNHAALTTRAALASVAMALFLLGLKGWAAWTTGSVAVLGSLADTALDVIASLVTLFGVRVAAMPADSDHRFGHGKAEAIAALVQAGIIIVSALGIFWQAAARLTAGERTVAGGAGHRRLAGRDPAHPGADRLSAQRDPPHRLDRDRRRPAPLPERPGAQPFGDRGAGARSICRPRPAPTRCSASASPVAALERAGRLAPCDRPADGQGMAGGQTPSTSSPSPPAAPRRRAFTMSGRAAAEPQDFAQFHIWVDPDDDRRRGA